MQDARSQLKQQLVNLGNTMSTEIAEKAHDQLNETEAAILGLNPNVADAESVVAGAGDSQKEEDESTEVSNKEEEEELEGSEPDSEEDGGETPAEKPDAEKSEELDSKSGLPVKVQQRIDKITAEKGDLRTKLAERDSEIMELKQKLDGKTVENLVLTPTLASPLTDVLNEVELDNRVAAAKRAKRWALQNINGAVVAGSGGAEDREYTEQEVRQIMANADELLTETAPARRQFLKDQALWDAQAKTVYPGLFDAKTPLYQEAVGYIKAMPELLRFPDFKVCIGDFIEGRKLRIQREADAAVVKTGDKELVAKQASKPVAAALAPKVPILAARGSSAGKGAGALVQQARGRVQNGSASVEDQNALIGSFL